MIDLEKIFAEKVFTNIEAARVRKGLDAIDIIYKLIDKGVFSGYKTPTNEEINKLKENKRNIYNDWKSGKSKSYMKFVEEISEILDISLEELSDVKIIKNNGNILNNSINESDNAVLLIAKETENTLSRQEWELIELYRSLSIKKQVELVQTLLTISEELKDD